MSLDGTTRAGFGCFAAAVICFSSTLHAQITLTPGSVLGENSVAPGGTNFTLVKYHPSTGNVQETLALNTVPAGFGTMSGVTIVGNRVFTVGSGGIVAEVNLTTGELFNSFATTLPSEGLGNLGGDLLVSASNGTIRRFSTAGALLGTITLNPSPGLRGSDSDGTQFFVASNSGLIHRYDLTGTFLGSINTGIAGSSLSGLGYDDATGNLWVSTGFGQDDIRAYTQTGTLVTSFPAQFPFINGLEIIPEPGALPLLALAGLGLSMRRSALTLTTRGVIRSSPAAFKPETVIANG